MTRSWAYFSCLATNPLSTSATNVRFARSGARTGMSQLISWSFQAKREGSEMTSFFFIDFAPDLIHDLKFQSLSADWNPSGSKTSLWAGEALRDSPGRYTPWQRGVETVGSWWRSPVVSELEIDASWIIKRLLLAAPLLIYAFNSSCPFSLALSTAFHLGLVWKLWGIYEDSNDHAARCRRKSFVVILSVPWRTKSGCIAHVPQIALRPRTHLNDVVQFSEKTGQKYLATSVCCCQQQLHCHREIYYNVGDTFRYL